MCHLCQKVSFRGFSTGLPTARATPLDGSVHQPEGSGAEAGSIM